MDMPRQKAQRATSEERRDHLVRACLKCLVADGHAGISVRRIAKEAGVAVGLVNHHFGSIDALVALDDDLLRLGSPAQDDTQTGSD